MERVRLMLAMGLAACEKEPAQQAVTIAPPAASSVATAPSARAEPSASASVAVAPPVPVVGTPLVRGLSNVPSFEAQYAHKNSHGCTTAEAHCYLLSDLKKMAGAGSTCPAQEDVPQGCAPGSSCIDPTARTTGDLLPAVSKTESAGKGATACCYTVPDYCCPMCGRTLRVDDRIVTTPLAGDRSAPFDARAARFAAMAAAEHASIASFARAVLELLALGAPQDLVRDTQLAALDECEHARKCYALASRIGGVALEPGKLSIPAPGEAPTFASVAVATFLDACVGETIGVAQLREMIAVERDPEVAAMLEEIAADEERHVELAFRTLAWAVRAGGEPAADALQRAALNLGPRECVHRTVGELVVPCVEALLASGARRGASSAGTPRWRAGSPEASSARTG